MAQSIVFNNATYIIPDVGESSWGQNLTNFFVAISSGCYQLSGGTNPLTADLSFGSNFGLFAKYLTSVTATPATAGAVRLAKTDAIEWRNTAGGGNLPLAINSSDELTFNGAVVTTLAVPLPIAAGGTNSVTALVNGKLIASIAGAIAESGISFSGTTITASLTGLASLNLALAGGTMSGDIAMGTHKITGLGNGSAAQDAAAFGQITAVNAGALPLTGGTMSGDIAMGAHKVTGLAAATTSGDAVRFEQLPVNTPLTTWSPTISGFGTVANTTAKYLQTGGLVYCWVTFQAGTPAGSPASITLPVNVNSALSSAGSYLGKSCQGRAENLLSNGDDSLVFYDGSTAGTAFFANTGSGTTPIYVKANGNTLASASQYVSMFFSYPA